MPLAEQERAAIRDLAATGASCTTIATTLGLSVGAVAGSLSGGRKQKVDAAVIDRIRMLHEEGMGQRRIADTVGLSESTVARYLPGSLLGGTVLASGNGNGSTPAPANAPDPVAEPFVEDPGEPVAPAPPPGPAPLPLALQSPPTAKQRAAWEAYHRLGSQGAAGRELGIHQGGVRTALLAYMRAMGIDGPIPPPANAPVVVRTGADHASDIPAALPDADAAPLNDVKRTTESAQERKPSEPAPAPWVVEARREYVGTLITLLAKGIGDTALMDRIERVLECA